MSARLKTKVILYLQIAFIKAMYLHYYGYVVTLGLISLFMPLYLARGKILGQVVDYKEELMTYWKEILDELSRQEYEYNKRRLSREIKEKLDSL